MFYCICNRVLLVVAVPSCVAYINCFDTWHMHEIRTVFEENKFGILLSCCNENKMKRHDRPV